MHALARLSQDEFSRGFLLAALSGSVAIPEAVLEALHKNAARFQAEAGFFSLLFEGRIAPRLKDGELTWQLTEAGKLAGARLTDQP
jgi:hypothetical protein